MANEPSVLARQQPRPDAAGASDYQAFSEVLAASARGRAFLAEHTRRSRSADTSLLLAALARLEALMQAKAAAPVDSLRAELTTLLDAIRSMRPDIEACELPVRAAKLAVLLNLLEDRIAAMAAPAPPLAAPATAVEPGRTRLAVVPPPDEPELPIPSPDPAPPPPTVLARAPETPVTETATNIPEVIWFRGAPPGPAAFEDEIKWERGMSPPMAETAAASNAVIAKPPEPAALPGEIKPGELANANLAPPDPLAAFMMLSEDERIALFT